MNDPERKDLSKAEWKVMKIVWELRKAMAREVYTIACEQHSWTPATVKTILKRLVDKGYVSTTQVGNGFVYRPAQTALSTLQSAADTLLTNAVEGVTGPAPGSHGRTNVAERRRPRLASEAHRLQEEIAQEAW